MRGMRNGAVAHAGERALGIVLGLFPVDRQEDKHYVFGSEPLDECVTVANNLSFGFG